MPSKVLQCTPEKHLLQLMHSEGGVLAGGNSEDGKGLASALLSEHADARQPTVPLPSLHSNDDDPSWNMILLTFQPTFSNVSHFKMSHRRARQQGVHQMIACV